MYAIRSYYERSLPVRIPNSSSRCRGKYESSFSVNIKGTVEAGAEIFECNGGGQFDQFCRTEILRQGTKQIIGNRGRGTGHSLGVGQDRLLKVAETGAVTKVR